MPFVQVVYVIVVPVGNAGDGVMLPESVTALSELFLTVMVRLAPPPSPDNAKFEGLADIQHRCAILKLRSYDLKSSGMTNK